MADSEAAYVPPTVLAGIPGRVSGSVDAYRLMICCPCGEKVPYPTITAPSVCICGNRWSVA